MVNISIRKARPEGNIEKCLKIFRLAKQIGYNPSDVYRDAKLSRCLHAKLKKGIVPTNDTVAKLEKWWKLKSDYNVQVLEAVKEALKNGCKASHICKGAEVGSRTVRDILSGVKITKNVADKVLYWCSNTKLWDENVDLSKPVKVEQQQLTYPLLDEILPKGVTSLYKTSDGLIFEDVKDATEYEELSVKLEVLRRKASRGV